MKVSVIVPTLNEGRCVGSLLSSLEKQTFKDFEVIVVDGGSKDDTIGLAERNNAKVLVRVGMKEFPSRNEGAKIANGELLLFTGADIIFYEQAVEKMVNKFEKEKLDGLCGFGSMYDAPIWGEIEYYFYYSFIKFWTNITGVHGSTNFMMCRREEFEKTGGFENRIDGDGHFMKLFAKNRRTTFIDGTEVFSVSGRRMKKMGFFGYNFHFLYVIDAFLCKYQFLRDSKVIKYLERASVNYRASESRQSL